MNKQTKTMLLTITAAALALPVAGFALAQSAPKSAPVMTQPLAQTQTDTEMNDSQNPAIKGSIALPNSQNGMENGSEVADAQETAQYQGLAKITSAQASAAAQAVIKGTVTSVGLGDENGYLVYDVVIGNQAVIVDAGNGKVLYQGGMDAGDNENDNEMNDD